MPKEVPDGSGSDADSGPRADLTAITRDTALPDDDVRVGSRELIHDVVNALAMARNYAQLLAHRLPSCTCDFHQDAESLSAITTNVELAIQLLTGQSDLKPGAVSNVGSLLRASVATVPPERARDIVIRMPDDAMLLDFWDPLAMSRILANLLDNSTKYSLPGTPIEVAMTTGHAGVEIVFSDRGIGVCETELEIIFAGHRSAAAQATAGGHGLGLQSSRRLAEEMGGRLWATGGTDGGLAVHLYLPWPEAGDGERISDEP